MREQIQAVIPGNFTETISSSKPVTCIRVGPVHQVMRELAAIAVGDGCHQPAPVAAARN